MALRYTGKPEVANIIQSMKPDYGSSAVAGLNDMAADYAFQSNENALNVASIANAKTAPEIAKLQGEAGVRMAGMAANQGLLNSLTSAGSTITGGFLKKQQADRRAAQTADFYRNLFRAPGVG